LRYKGFIGAARSERSFSIKSILKTPFKIICQKCCADKFVFIRKQDTSFEYYCEQCGENQLILLDATIQIGRRLLERSLYEINEQRDYEFSIVLSATAMECELSRLYCKWRRIEELGKKEIRDQELEEELRKMENVKNKIDQISKFLTKQGLGEFVKGKNNLNSIVKNNFPSLAIDELTKNVAEHLFWPRNKILHYGKTSFKKTDADRCWSFSNLGITILHEMDKLRALQVSE
jgi:hypothetical protein